VHPDALRYPCLGRILSGAAEAYAFFVFPTDMPLTDFIQAVPEIMVYINYGK
jgi:hypothetical protein